MSALRRPLLFMWLPMSLLLLRKPRAFEAGGIPKKSALDGGGPAGGTIPIRGSAVRPSEILEAIQAAAGRRLQDRSASNPRRAIAVRLGLLYRTVSVEVPRCGNLVPRSRNPGSRYEVPRCGNLVPTFRNRCLHLGTARPAKQTVRRQARRDLLGGDDFSPIND